MILFLLGLATAISIAMTFVVLVGDLGRDVSLVERLKAVAIGSMISVGFISYFLRELRVRREDKAKADQERAKDPRPNDWKGDPMDR